MRRVATATLPFVVTVCLALPIARGQDVGIKPAPLLVWSGDRPQGQTWAQLGAGGSITIEDGAGTKGGKGLAIRMGGDGYRGCGLNWKGWFPPGAATDASRYTALVFMIRQVTKVADADLQVSLVDNVKRPDKTGASNTLSIRYDGGVAKIDATWQRVVLPLERFAMNKPLQVDKLWEVDFANVGKDALTFQIDQVGFAVEKVAPRRFAAAPAYHATARVAPDKVLHRIKDTIYGVCGLPREKLAEYRIPITRWGGNPATRYNWKLGVDNGGADWYFKNRGKRLDRLSDTGYLKHIEGNQVRGATTYQTVPMIGWVAKDDHSYGFSMKKYGPQKTHEPGNPDVGNGVRRDGSRINDSDPRDTSVPAPPEFIGDAVRYVVKRAGRADGADGKAGVQYWALDNEPMIWHATHRDVYPRPLGYDELWERTVRYAEAIKQADPTCKVAGFCSWGWTDLFYSAKDEGTDRYGAKPDWQAHGAIPLGEWFILKCGEYRKKHGRPLVDVFDFHWYPQGQVKGRGVYLGRGPDVGLNELRMRSTRDLWDAKYSQESWIGGDKNAPTTLIPRLQKWIAAHNPGMELCLGEYNFGGSDNLTGGLAQADCFGLFARYRLDLAFIWYSPEGTQDLAWQLFRSYDGAKGCFGDGYLASTSDHPNLAIFGARRKADGAVTIALVNKDLHSPCIVALDVGQQGTMQVWRFDQENADRVREVKDAAGTVRAQVRLTLPAASASMVVIDPRPR